MEHFRPPLARGLFRHSREKHEIPTPVEQVCRETIIISSPTGALKVPSRRFPTCSTTPPTWSAGGPVYLAVEQLEDGDADGVGKVYRLHTRGWLPYTLHWQFRVTASRKPYGWTLDAWGDFVGRGIWTFEQQGPYVTITYD